MGTFHGLDRQDSEEAHNGTAVQRLRKIERSDTSDTFDRLTYHYPHVNLLSCIF